MTPPRYKDFIASPPGTLALAEGKGDHANRSRFTAKLKLSECSSAHAIGCGRVGGNERESNSTPTMRSGGQEKRGGGEKTHTPPGRFPPEPFAPAGRATRLKAAGKCGR